jgi:hypothetical protein
MSKQLPGRVRMVSMAVLVALGAVAAACGGSDGADPSVSGTVASDPAPDDTAEVASTDPPAATPTTQPPEASTSDVDVTVTSDDGTLEVFVPAGAGPADVVIEAIELTEQELADAEVLAVGYDLGPDGASYTEPVTLTFELPAATWADGDGVPLVFVVGDGDDVPFPATIARNGDTLTVSADVDHFSRYYVILTSSGHLELELDEEAIVPAGGQGSPRVTGRFIEGSDLILETVSGQQWTIDDPPFALLGTSSGGPFGGTTADFTVINAAVSCEEAGTSSAVTVEFDVSYSVAPDPLGAKYGLFAALSLGDELAASSHIRLDGGARCVAPTPPTDTTSFLDGVEGVPDFVGAYLGTSGAGELGLGFVVADPAAPVSYPVVVIFDGVSSTGEPIIVECLADTDAACRGFAGSGYSPLDADFRTEFAGGDGVWWFDQLDLIDVDGVLQLDLVDAVTDVDLGAGPYELTGLTVAVNVQELGGSAWFWDPAELQAGSTS